MGNVLGTPFSKLAVQTFDEVGKLIWNNRVYCAPVFLVLCDNLFQPRIQGPRKLSEEGLCLIKVVLEGGTKCRRIDPTMMSESKNRFSRLAYPARIVKLSSA